MTNWALKLAIVRSGRPAYVIAAEAGMSACSLTRTIHQGRQTTKSERESLARALSTTEDAIFPPLAFQAA